VTPDGGCVDSLARGEIVSPLTAIVQTESAAPRSGRTGSGSAALGLTSDEASGGRLWVLLAGGVTMGALLLFLTTLRRRREPDEAAVVRSGRRG
jgi:hypothetical protein